MPRSLTRVRSCEPRRAIATRTELTRPQRKRIQASQLAEASSLLTCMRPAPKQVRMLTLTLFMQQIYACTHVDLAGENSLKYIDVTNQQRMLLVGELP